MDVADSSSTRRTGLLKHDRLDAGQGLWITPCESVHTFFMKFPIDLVYLDKQKKVRKVRHAVPAWRLSMCLSARSILELPAGTAQRTGTLAGDQLVFERSFKLFVNCQDRESLTPIDAIVIDFDIDRLGQRLRSRGVNSFRLIKPESNWEYLRCRSSASASKSMWPCSGVAQCSLARPTGSRGRPKGDPALLARMSRANWFRSPRCQLQSDSRQSLGDRSFHVIYGDAVRRSIERSLPRLPDQSQALSSFRGPLAGNRTDDAGQGAARSAANSPLSFYVENLDPGLHSHTLQ